MLNEELFKALVKATTSASISSPLGHMFAKGQYRNAALFLKALIRNLRVFGYNFAYQDLHKPVYRGINPNKSSFKLEDYELNSIGQWPLF
jgi:hypothetical protein